MRRKTSLVAASAVALITGLALGTPVAAQAGRLLTGSDIKDGTVTTADVANGSLKRKDFAPGALPAAGADGADGADGVNGTDGVDGAPGEQGPPGPDGARGPEGPEGPSGVVATEFQTGADAPTSSLDYVAAPATVTVRADEKVAITSSAALGSTGGAVDLDLDVCYSDGLTIHRIPGGGVNDLTALTGQQQLFTLSAVTEGLVGTFSFGLCGRTTHPADWDVESGGQTTVHVLETD